MLDHKKDGPRSCGKGGWSGVRKAYTRGEKELSVRSSRQPVRLGRGGLLEKPLAFLGRRSSRFKKLNMIEKKNRKSLLLKNTVRVKK